MKWVFSLTTKTAHRLLRYHTLLVISMSAWCPAFSQVEVPLANPSFEGIAFIGTNQRKNDRELIPIEGWRDWYLFPGNSSPDLHCSNCGFWNVYTTPHDGQTFVSLVTRPDETWECLGQELQTPLEANSSYMFTVFLCRHMGYRSPVWNPGDSRWTRNSRDTEEVPFNHPTILRIWGSNEFGVLEEILGESEPVLHADWQQYAFDFIPERTYKYLVLGAYFPPGAVRGTAGHILIDNAKLFKYE